MYDFIVNYLKFEEKNIIVFGRSIGSGPASYLASQREPAVLVLMSAFTSFRGIVKDLVGKVF